MLLALPLFDGDTVLLDEFTAEVCRSFSYLYLEVVPRQF
jgi:hypothetical protein